MIRVYLIPLLAIAGVLFAVITVVRQSIPAPVALPVIQPPQAPYESFVAGSAIIEPSSQSIAVGSPVGDIVQKVAVTAGDTVNAGDVLFELDTRVTAALLRTREAALEVAQGELAKLAALPRKEEVPPAQARADQARAQLADLEAQWATWQGVQDQRAVSREELDRKRFAVDTARAALAAAQAELDLLLAGAFAPDVAIARARVDSARADADSARAELERRTVRAPVTGRVLQVNVRPGEFVPAGVTANPPILMGAVEPLYVRVDVDENHAWRVREGAPAHAYLRGNKDIESPLTFVRFEPYVVPKRSLTGDSTERVDTRVLQVLYSINRADLAVYVGQQMDVYIKAEPITDAPASGGAAVEGSVS